MPGVAEQRRRPRVRAASRQTAQLSPELNEVLKMLEALEDEPETAIARADEGRG